MARRRGTGWQLLAAVGRRHRARLGLTYGLTLLENVADVLYPFTIGMAVDGLLAGKPERLAPLIALWLAHLVVGLWRHLYDTRVYTDVYGTLATEAVEAMRGRGVETSAIIGRIALSRELIDFLQTDIPALARALVRAIGAAAMLMLYDTVIGAMVAVALVPVIAANAWFARTSARLNAGLNDRLERQGRMLARARPPEVRRHFGRLRWWQIRISNAEAGTWGVIELTAIALTLGVLLRLTYDPGVTAGTIYAVLAYVFTFYEATSELPVTIENAARVRDIGDRLAG